MLAFLVSVWVLSISPISLLPIPALCFIIWSYYVSLFLQASMLFLFSFNNIIFKKKISFFLDRCEGRERETETWIWERNIVCLSYMTWPQGWNLQPRCMSWSGIKPTTFCFVGWCPSNWATPVRAHFVSCLWAFIQSILSFWSPSPHPLYSDSFYLTFRSHLFWNAFLLTSACGHSITTVC